ncbi:hypothetical protein [Frateuria sp.]|uniref:hypothetical protein n=1 Tax=Frateuria sp. TaxID=2211372 RepID=UPI003F809D88
MAELQLPNIVGQYSQGFDRGQGQRANRLAGLAYSSQGADRQSALGQLAGVDPRLAVGLGNAFQQQDAAQAQAQKTAEVDHAKKLNGAARYMLSAVESGDPARIQGSWQSVRPYLAELSGKEPPEQFDQAMLPKIYEIVGQTGGDAMTAGDSPSGFREFQLTAQAAGLKPGTPEYQQAANIALGREGRASNAGIGFQKITGADGRERIGRTNPRTGAFEVYNEQTGQFEPMGGAMGEQNNAQGVPASIQTLLQQANQAVQMGADPNKVDQWLKQQAAQISGVQVQPTANPALAVSRSPEDTAYAKEQATQRAQLEALPQREAIQTQAAIQQTQGTEQVKNQASIAKQNAERSRDARGTLALLDEAEKLLPNATGSAAGSLRDKAAASVGVSTPGAQATAQLQTIAGQLTSKMPRMQGPQSDRDVELYKQMAGDLANPNLPVATRMAALRTIRVLNEKYAGQQGQTQAPTRPRATNPQTGQTVEFDGQNWVPVNG